MKIITLLFVLAGLLTGCDQDDVKRPTVTADAQATPAPAKESTNAKPYQRPRLAPLKREQML